MKSAIKRVMVTGLSGAGKHQVLYLLEDLGYFCVDNLPAPLISPCLEFFQSESQQFSRIAIGVDVRAHTHLEKLKRDVIKLRRGKNPLRILFLEAKENELLRRFAETRRHHPLKENLPLPQRIRQEMKQLGWLREEADLIIDTTRLTPPELRRQLFDWLSHETVLQTITLSTFGYKYGLPADADMIWDVRFLPNPFYLPRLKALTGNHRSVRDYVLRHEIARKSIKYMAQLIPTMMPGFLREGKTTFHLAVGCTGGQHRSVVMANALRRLLSGQVKVFHRELSGL